MLYLFPNPDQNGVIQVAYDQKIAWKVHTTSTHKFNNTTKQIRTRIFISSDGCVRIMLRVRIRKQDLGRDIKARKKHIHMWFSLSFLRFLNNNFTTDESNEGKWARIYLDHTSHSFSCNSVPWNLGGSRIPCSKPIQSSGHWCLRISQYLLKYNEIKSIYDWIANPGVSG